MILPGSLLLMALAVLLVASTSAAQREERPLLANWRFARGESPDAMGRDVDDSAWHEVALPHDWAIAGPFDPEGDASTAKLPWKDVGWYRRRLDLPDLKGQRVLLDFGGVMADAQVFLNGRPVGSWDYGYTSFVLDVTDAAREGENVLAVRADTTGHGSRWYPGGGIYRPVTLRLVNEVHVPTWGQSVTTPSVTDSMASVAVTTEIRNAGDRPREVHWRMEILDPDGEGLSATEETATIPAGETRMVSTSFLLKSPRRWDVDDPALHTARTTLFADDAVVDQVVTPFGIRTFKFTADDGFHLNGRRVQMNGVNLHHDLGMLGAAFYPDAAERQLRIMKEMGVNAVRTAHNPPAAEVLDLCDRLGLVVINELFDKWDRTAGFEGDLDAFIADFAPRHVDALIRRDRNHPSVVLWSIGNEIGNILNNDDGRSAAHVADMVKLFRDADSTRPITMGMHIPRGGNAEPRILDALDVQMWNYGEKYLHARRAYPDVPMVYSESSSGFSVRGEYGLPLEVSKTDFPRDYSSGYDRNAAPWGDLPDHEFERMTKHAFVAGEFVWSGFDYLGEPTPYSDDRWIKDLKPAETSRSSYFGLVDLVGLPKDRYWLYRSHWRPGEATVHLLPHWNWPDRVGEIVPVYVYTNGDEAELFLNGESLGRRSKGVAAEGGSAANLAAGGATSASSVEVRQDSGGNVQAEFPAAHALDGNWDTRWSAADATFPQQWQVDLGERQAVRSVRLTLAESADEFDLQLLASDDGETWTPLPPGEPAMGHAAQIDFAFDAQLRHLRVAFNGGNAGRRASLRDVVVSASEDPASIPNNTYYAPLPNYRLMWDDVVYQPGELRAVAYRDGEYVGEATVKTAGEATSLCLVPETHTMKADLLGLAFVRVEAIDVDGNVCPLDNRAVHLDVTGPATLVAFGNGHPRGHDPLQDADHPLSYGQAIAIVRGTGEAGEVTVVATADGVDAATATVTAR